MLVHKTERKMVKTFVFIVLILFCSCSESTSLDQNPEWVTKLILKYEREPVGNPLQSIWRYEYKNKIVYYVPAQCCDQFSSLFDKDGNLICAPDGGLSGRGNGGCSDFFTERKNEKLIWKDSRSR